MDDVIVITRNWDNNARYTFGVGMGYYFDGVRVKKVAGGKLETTKLDHEKRFVMMENTLGRMVKAAKEYGEVTPFLLIDDCSPISFPFKRISKVLKGHPFAFVRLPENLGCGGKENVLQRVLAERCEYVIRCDDDVALDPFSFSELKAGFDEMEDAFAITTCITYFARLEASQLPVDQRYFYGSNIADFVTFRASIFKDVGYSDHKARYNDDGDLRLRCLAALGMRCYVDKKLTGKAIVTGASGSIPAHLGYEKRLKVAKYLDETRPFIKVVFPEGKTPRLTPNKKYMAEMKRRGKSIKFYVPAHPYADEVASRLWGASE